MSGFAGFFTEGGLWMVPIAFVSVLAVAIGAERIYSLFAVYNVNGSELWHRIKALLAKDQLNQAIKLCDQHGKSALAGVLKSGLSSAERGQQAVENSIDEAVTEVTPVIQKRNSALAGLASLSTLLGLLGTVMGLIEAFRVVADAPPDQKSILLTKSISVAMNTTAFGLMVAIPTMFLYLIVSGGAKKISDDIENYSLKLENLLGGK